MRHIHWFRKTKIGADLVDHHAVVIRYKQCRCGNLKIVDFYSYVESLERLTGIPKDKLTGVEVGLMTSAEVNK